MPSELLLRLFGPAVLAVIVTIAIDLLTARRRLTPPAWSAAASGGGSLRRWASLVLLAAVLYFAVLQTLGAVGLDREIDLSGVTAPQLFVTHAIFVFGLVGWYVLGFAGWSSAPGASPARQLGFAAPKIWQELVLGLICGVVGWFGVMAVSFMLAWLIQALGGDAALPTEPSPVVVFIAGLPAGVRLLISMSAGLVEETFFRGFLQPRVGILFSTLLFATGHLSYDQPTLLVGITLLSLFFAGLVEWRQNLWAAIVAHAVFDGIQLLILIPAVLDWFV